MSDTETSQTNDQYGYGKLSVTELRKVVSDLTKQVLELKKDKKEWVSAANDAIKETNARIERAVEALRENERASTATNHDSRTLDFLRAVPQHTN